MRRKTRRRPLIPSISLPSHFIRNAPASFAPSHVPNDRFTPLATLASEDHDVAPTAGPTLLPAHAASLAWRLGPLTIARHPHQTSRLPPPLLSLNCHWLSPFPFPTPRRPFFPFKPGFSRQPLPPCLPVLPRSAPSSPVANSHPPNHPLANRLLQEPLIATLPLPTATTPRLLAAQYSYQPIPATGCTHAEVAALPLPPAPPSMSPLPLIPYDIAIV